MKINEVTNIPQTYVATVRVVIGSGSTTARTTITADTSSSAFVMLTRLYGVGNVLSITEVMRESPQTDQIQREAAISPLTAQIRAQLRKIAQIQSSQVAERKRVQRKQVSARPIPDLVKHQRIQNRLTKQFMRQSNIVKPTEHDVRVARNRADMQLKKADLQHKQAMERQFRRLERQ